MRSFTIAVLLLLSSIAVLFTTQPFNAVSNDAKIGSANAAGPYSLPPVAEIVATIPSGAYFPTARVHCPVRLDASGSPVTLRFFCYVNFIAADPIAPPPYHALIHRVVIGSFNSSTGHLTAEILGCTPAVPGLAAISARIDIPVNKVVTTGVSGNFLYIRTDTTSPSTLNCNDGSEAAGSLSFTPRTATHDTDGDLCPDYKELGDSGSAGGVRDPFNPFDYFNPTHDGRNRIDDALKVISQYFDDDTNGTPGEPPYSAGYDPATDRTHLGPNPWNLGHPNGQQRIDDVLAQLKQYFHDCP